MATSLASYLPVEFNLRYTEHKNVKGKPVILPESGIMVHLHIESADANAFVTVPPQFARLLINACYGGAERDPKLEPTSSFTQFEHSFVGDLCRSLVKSALRTSSNEHALATNLNATLVAKDQENIRLETADGLEVTWELRIAEYRQVFVTHIPSTCITAGSTAQGTQNVDASSPVDAEWSNQLRDKLNNTVSKLQAVIRLGEISLGNVSSLKTGSTIEIGKAGSIELTIDSEGQSIFSGKMGQKNGHYAVNIERSLKK